MTALAHVELAGGLVALLVLVPLAVGFLLGRRDAAAEAERRLERLPHHGPPRSHLRLLPARPYDQDAG